MEQAPRTKGFFYCVSNPISSCNQSLFIGANLVSIGFISIPKSLWSKVWFCARSLSSQVHRIWGCIMLVRMHNAPPNPHETKFGFVRGAWSHKFIGFGVALCSCACITQPQILLEPNLVACKKWNNATNETWGWFFSKSCYWRFCLNQDPTTFEST